MVPWRGIRVGVSGGVGEWVGKFRNLRSRRSVRLFHKAVHNRTCTSRPINGHFGDLNKEPYTTLPQFVGNLSD